MELSFPKREEKTRGGADFEVAVGDEGLSYFKFEIRDISVEMPHR